MTQTATDRDAWASDPATLELILHAALEARDMPGVAATLRLMAGCDPRRAATLLEVVNVALALRSEVAR